MSFLRVGAFVLVHAGMMLVVFTPGEMASGPIYVLIVVAGNALVICLGEGLLVGIQVLRLEFYEMFNRFFGDRGRPFTPSPSAPQIPDAGRIRQNRNAAFERRHSLYLTNDIQEVFQMEYVLYSSPWYFLVGSVAPGRLGCEKGNQNQQGRLHADALFSLSAFSPLPCR